ncbi:MAG: hypothetical protein R3Y53_03695 [Bacillota bacterium]
MNLIKKEIAELKNNTEGMTNAQKFNHIYYYYKFHFVFVVVMVVLLGSLIQTVVTKKDTHFYGLFINVIANENERNYLTDFYAEQFEVDLKKEEIVLDDTLFFTSDSQDMMGMASQQKLVALVATGSADTIAAEEDTFFSLAYSNFFYDLRDCLSDKEIALYEPYFCYIDKDVLDILEEARYETPTEEVVIEVFPESLEEMTNPIPVGLLVGSQTNLGKTYRFMGTGVIGIPASTQQLEQAKDFLSVALNY